MSRNTDEEAAFRAQKALTSIHEAREAADEAFDKMMKAHQSGQEVDAHEQQFHTAVMMLYNRLRPYIRRVPEYAQQVPLHVEKDENGDPITKKVDTEEGMKEKPVGIFGLLALDEWRMGSTTISQVQERVGSRDKQTESEQPIKMPNHIAINAYDALQEAIVELDFAAEPNTDVDQTHLDDAPDQVGDDKELPDEMAGGGAAAEGD